MDKEQLEDKFGKMKAAYKSLFIVSISLLELGAIHWTERILLRLVHALSKQRLGQIKGAFPDDVTGEDEKQLKENMLEARIEAALGNHHLGEWGQLEDGQGYQAACANCGGTVFVNHKTIYTILQDRCPSTG